MGAFILVRYGYGITQVLNYSGQASLRKDTESEDSDRELSGKDDSKAANDVDLDEVNAGVVNATVGVEDPSGVTPEITEDVAIGNDVRPTEVVPPHKVFPLEEQSLTLGVPMGYLVKKLGELRDTMFRLLLEKKKGALDQFIKVNKLMRALELQRKIVRHGAVVLDPISIKCSTYLFVHKRCAVIAHYFVRHINGSPLNPFKYKVTSSTKYLLVVPFNLCVSLTLLGIVRSIKKVRVSSNIYVLLKAFDAEFSAWLGKFIFDSFLLVSLEPSVARSSIYLFVVLGMCSNTTCLKLTISFSAIVRYGAKVISFTAKLS
ncbi:hypothetical protein D8674_000364 [Pyrus ussuriensis x Pyrus communis]|uniref:Uncharacterized protein n=1 Tax=Pyrus ussuriensis x Pyrus communis TaxID=2448454 RepID=A0A5N5FGD2_9ROSA|nr:hypothetical protein D8674_000364 [Pyrus ussuriensis x Pyrus communis]